MANEDASATNLEQVRQILIGDHTAKSRARMKALEETITRELANLRSEVFKRLDTLEANAKKERDELREESSARHAELAEECGAGFEELRSEVVGKEELSGFLGDIALQLVDRKQIRRS